MPVSRHSRLVYHLQGVGAHEAFPMSAADAIAFYDLGFQVMLGVGGSAMMTVILARWARNIMSSR